MIKNKLKSNKGFTGTDIVISLIVLVMFTGVLVTTFYNYYLSISAKNRNAIATNCIIDVIENIQMVPYENIDEQKVNEIIQALYNNNTIQDQYTVTAKLEKYNEMPGNEQKYDVIKKITVNVKYNVGNNERQIEISNLITNH